jgi:hypothetical protein
MKTLKSIVSLAVLLFVVAFISSFVTKGTGKTSSVSGGGTAWENSEKSTFVFNAVEKDGQTHGFLEYHFRSSDIDIRMDITCLRIDGKRATLAGEVVSVKGENVPAYIFEGQHGSFTVEDNGNGGDGDKISDLILGSSTSCANNLPTYLNLKGNITIRE